MFFGIDKKIRRAEQVRAEVIERAKALEESLSHLGSIEVSQVSIEVHAFHPNGNGNGNGNGKKVSIKELQKRADEQHQLVEKMRERADMLTRILTGLQDHRQRRHHVTGA